MRRGRGDDNRCNFVGISFNGTAHSEREYCPSHVPSCCRCNRPKRIDAQRHVRDHCATAAVRLPPPGTVNCVRANVEKDGFRIACLDDTGGAYRLHVRLPSQKGKLGAHSREPGESHTVRAAHIGDVVRLVVAHCTARRAAIGLLVCIVKISRLQSDGEGCWRWRLCR